MTAAAPTSFRTDTLVEKHETMDGDGTASIEVDVAGERLTVLVPEWVPKARAVRAIREGDLLLVLAENEAPPNWGMKGRGAVIVARKDEAGVWAAGIWHDLHEGTVAALTSAPEGDKR